MGIAIIESALLPALFARSADTCCSTCAARLLLAHPFKIRLAATPHPTNAAPKVAREAALTFAQWEFVEFFSNLRDNHVESLINTKNLMGA